MANNVLDIGKVLMKQGKRMFLGCECKAEEGFAVQVVQAKNGLPLIDALVCKECGNGYNVNGGFIV